MSFDFTKAMRGSEGRGLDLVIVVDTTTGSFGDTDSTQVRRRIEALSRALDVARSSLVLTVVLAGAALAGDIEALSETCRVLIVEPISVDLDGNPQDDKARRQLEDRIRLLLPLEIPPRDDGQGNEPTAIESLVAGVPDDVNKDFLKALMASSRLGDEAVTQELAAFIGSRLYVEGDE
ncbi:MULTISPECIES: hypothetical protein [Mesorhizobium]|uniref:hypothetical protein n=1 Tax=Mesorhizobium TaxID=68287 RepID=UPI0010A960D6|nr:MULTISPECIES: hypothetical protein [Mesorhizobium]